MAWFLGFEGGLGYVGSLGEEVERGGGGEGGLVVGGGCVGMGGGESGVYGVGRGGGWELIGDR